MGMIETDSEGDEEREESWPPRKLDLAYFTNPNRCPQMVRRGARGAFELFLYLAHRYLAGRGEPVLTEHAPMCAACGLRPENLHSRSGISRLLRTLRETCGVIEYEPVQRRRPQVRLAPATPGADILNPRHYVYLREDWNESRRAMFNTLGRRAFATEYMLFVATYEAALARVKQGRPYWFFPLEEIAARYHVSKGFAGAGLRGLVDLGIMRVTFGQFGLKAPNDEFGAANRYYFEGEEAARLQTHLLVELQRRYVAEFPLANAWALELTNGRTAKNVEGLCQLVAEHGDRRVRAAVETIAAKPARSLRRRIAYVRTLVLAEKGVTN